jgi:anhydro-N-acetylmuramic acid kinase
MIELFESARRRAGYGQADVPLEDLLATACELTARTIRQPLAESLRGRGPPLANVEVVASGGGVLNKHLMSRLAAEWPVRVTTVVEWGIPAEAKEAVAFALLGAATLDGVPSNIPAATGARRAVVLGSITPNPSA